MASGRLAECAVRGYETSGRLPESICGPSLVAVGESWLNIAEVEIRLRYASISDSRFGFSFRLCFCCHCLVEIGLLGSRYLKISWLGTVGILQRHSDGLSGSCWAHGTASRDGGGETSDLSTYRDPELGQECGSTGLDTAQPPLMNSRSCIVVSGCHQSASTRKHPPSTLRTVDTDTDTAFRWPSWTQKSKPVTDVTTFWLCQADEIVEIWICKVRLICRKPTTHRGVRGLVWGGVIQLYAPSSRVVSRP